MDSIPNWLQIAGNIAVFTVVAISSIYAYFHTRWGGTSAASTLAISSVEGNTFINQFVTKSLELMERNAIAIEEVAEALSVIAASMKQRDEDANIDRRIEERMRARHSQEDHGRPHIEEKKS